MDNDLDSTFELLGQFFKEEYSNYKNNNPESLIYDFKDHLLALSLQIIEILNPEFTLYIANKLN